MRVYLSWRDSTHAIIGVRTLTTNLTLSANQASYGISAD
jgi:hypothetical protein